MIIVTGGAGFIGSNFCIEVLNNLPNVDIVICDIFGSDEKWKNISQLQLHDIIKPEEIEKQQRCTCTNWCKIKDSHCKIKSLCSFMN